MMQFDLFNNILIILTITIAIHAICQRIKMPNIIGYILVGILVGPHAIGAVSESNAIKLIAEFGIVFLMFTVGLEFSLSHIIKLKKDVFGYGGLQVISTIIATTVIGMLFDMTLAQSMIVGFIVAMSSTAIVLKQLTEQLQINAPYSQHAIGILLFQDLAVIPILIFIPNLSELNMPILFNQLLLSLMKGSFAIILILFIGKRILRPLFYSMSSQYNLELFTLTILFITLGAAWITSMLGLSLALGAFLAGMMLGETEFRHQIKTDIRPFKDVLLGFFFITIGMQFNAQIMITAWHWMLLLLLALFFFKLILITLLGLYFTKSKETAAQTGLILAQGGEFGFAILILAYSNHLLPEDYAQVIVGSLLLSMTVAPILIRFHGTIVHFIFRHAQTEVNSEEALISETSEHMNDHIILCGYGRVGQNIARFFERAKLKYIALDLDPNRVKNARLAGDNVHYADAADYEILKHCNIEHAKAIVISFINTHAACNIIQEVRKHYKQLPIIVRTHDESETNLFYEKGATEVIPEVLEASLMMASHILLLMKVPPKEVYHCIDESRQNRYDLLRMVFPGQEALTTEETDYSKEGLSVVTLSENAYAVNRLIRELPFKTLNVKITTIRRGNHRIVEPVSSTRLRANDILVLYGSLSNLERAEELLIIGN